jgi:hypothetical protein
MNFSGESCFAVEAVSGKYLGCGFFISLELRCKHASCWIISMIGYEQITMRKNGWNVGLL